MRNSTDRIESYNNVLNKIKLKKIVIIQGLRRIGKTLVMKSVGNDKIFSKYEKIEFLVGFFGQNDTKLAGEILKMVSDNPNKRYLILMDEFQDFVDWDKFFKTLHLYNNVKVIATGSISANLELVNNTEGGRFEYIEMQTLSFNEFKKIQTGGIGLNDEELFSKFATFGSYPDQEFTYEIFDYKKQVSENIIEKIKNISLLKRANIEDVQYVNNVLLYLIENIGQTISENSISTKLQIDVRIVKKILSYLKMTFIIYEVANSKQDKGRAAQSNKKYYLNDHTFYLFVKQSSYSELQSEYKNFLFENIIINEVKKRFTKYEVETRFEIDKKNNIDFDLVILKNDNKKYFEIKNSKSQNSLSKSQLKSEKSINVIYLGETINKNGIQYINYLEFIKEVEKWI